MKLQFYVCFYDKVLHKNRGSWHEKHVSEMKLLLRSLDLIMYLSGRVSANGVIIYRGLDFIFKEGRSGLFITQQDLIRVGIKLPKYK